MNKIQIAGFTALTLLGSLSSIQAAEATTDPVGYMSTPCPLGSDTLVTVPFAGELAYPGAVLGTPIQIDETLTIDVSGTPFIADEYNTLYMLRVTSGASEGDVFQITGTTASSIDIDLNGATPTIVDTTTFRIVKFWTLSTLVPPATQTTVDPAASAFATLNHTLILLPSSGNGINLSSGSSHYILSGQWNIVGGGDSSDTLLWPGSHFTIRHNAGVTVPTIYTPAGTVDTGKIIIPLNSLQASDQDNYVSIPRPIDITIADLGLTTTGTPAVFEPKNGAFDSTFDQIIVFDNTDENQNKSASATYFYNNDSSQWEKFGSSADAGTDIIPAASGIIIRKTASTVDQTVLWTNTPTY